MNSRNAFGFLVLGAVMWLLPVVAPAWFRHLAIDGTSTRALWVQVMGTVQVLLGSGYLLRVAVRGVGEMLDAVRALGGTSVPVGAAPNPVSVVDWIEDIVVVEFARRREGSTGGVMLDAEGDASSLRQAA